jgi:acyl carrier protein
MSAEEKLKQILIEFFELAPGSAPEQMSQQAIKKWDSLATVQLISQLEADFSVEFAFDEMDKLTSYAKIHAVLAAKGAFER